MATKKAAKKTPAKKKAVTIEGTGEDHQRLTKKNPDFYKIIGQRGGKRTLEVKGKGHYQKAAFVSHQPGVRASRSTLPVPQDDHIAGPRDKTRRRAK